MKEKTKENIYKAFIGEAKAYHVCQVCGYVTDKKKPAKCQVCGAPEKAFKTIGQG